MRGTWCRADVVTGKALPTVHSNWFLGGKWLSWRMCNGLPASCAMLCAEKRILQFFNFKYVVPHERGFHGR